MSHHVYVDESKQRDYLLVASVHASGDLGDLRKLMNRLTLPGQRRIHMKKEGDSRRRQIADAIVAAEVEATIYDAGRHHGDELAARALHVCKPSSKTPLLYPTRCSCSSRTTRSWIGTDASSSRSCAAAATHAFATSTNAPGSLTRFSGHLF